MKIATIAVLALMTIAAIMSSRSPTAAESIKDSLDGIVDTCETAVDALKKERSEHEATYRRLYKTWVNEVVGLKAKDQPTPYIEPGIIWKDRAIRYEHPGMIVASRLGQHDDFDRARKTDPYSFLEVPDPDRAYILMPCDNLKYLVQSAKGHVIAVDENGGHRIVMATDDLGDL